MGEDCLAPEARENCRFYGMAKLDFAKMTKDAYLRKGKKCHEPT